MLTINLHNISIRMLHFSFVARISSSSASTILVVTWLLYLPDLPTVLYDAKICVFILGVLVLFLIVLNECHSQTIEL